MSFGNIPVYDGDDVPDLNNVKLIDRYTPFDDKLAAIAAAAAVPPAWLEAWRHSTRGRTSALTRPEDMAGPEERLAVWRAVRDSGILPKHAAFFLVADEIRVLTEARFGEAEEDPEGLARRFPGDWDRLYAEALRAHGERKAARLYLADRGRFERRMRTGQRFFLPLPRPERSAAASFVQRPFWAGEFYEALAGARLIRGIDTTQIPFDHVWKQHPHFWEVVVALPPVEWVGGPRDKEIGPAGSLVDLRRLLCVLGRVHEFAWDPQARSGRYPPCVLVRGTWRGHRVVVRVLDRPFAAVVPVRVNAANGGAANV